MKHLILLLILPLALAPAFADVTPLCTDPDDPACPIQTGVQQNSQPASDGRTRSISGDDLCGSNYDDKCDIADAKTLFLDVISTITLLGSVVLVVLSAFYFVKSWFAYRAGNAMAIKQAAQNTLQAFLGFLMIIAVFGGVFAALLSALGVQEWTLKLWKAVTDSGLIEYAYADGFPSTFVNSSLYQLILSIANVVIKFFIYPAIVVMWVWSGFQFVFAQGNPDGLKKAKSWILWAFIITIITFSLQGFLQALRNTAETIIPFNRQEAESREQPRGNTGPQDGEPGSVCQTATGAYGVTGLDGTCQVGGVR